MEALKKTQSGMEDVHGAADADTDADGDVTTDFAVPLEDTLFSAVAEAVALVRGGPRVFFVPHVLDDGAAAGVHPVDSVDAVDGNAQVFAELCRSGVVAPYTPGHPTVFVREYMHPGSATRDVLGYHPRSRSWFVVIGETVHASSNLQAVVGAAAAAAAAKAAEAAAHIAGFCAGGK